MSKHTPGPWINNSSAVKANWPSGNIITICEANLITVIEGKKAPISEQHENLKLIAKAPKMFELLYRTLSEVNEEMGFDDKLLMEIDNLIKELS